MPTKASDQKFVLRVDKPLYEFFKKLAAKERRSINFKITEAMERYKEEVEKETPPSS